MQYHLASFFYNHAKNAETVEVSNQIEGDYSNLEKGKSFTFRGLTFRKMESKDEEIYVKIFTNSIMMKYDNNGVALSEEDAKRKFKREINNPMPLCRYAVCDGKTTVGFITLYEGDSNSEISFSYFIWILNQGKKFGSKYEGKRYGTRSLFAIIDFIKYLKYKNLYKFGEKNVIEAIVHHENKVSLHVISKAGFKQINKKPELMRNALSIKFQMSI